MKILCRWLGSLLVLGAFVARTSAQAQLDWMVTHDAGLPGLVDDGNGVAIDSTGDVFLITEDVLTPGPADAVMDLVKYSPTGALLWSRRFDLPSSSTDRAMDIQVAANGDVCIVGLGTAPDNDLFLLRYDTNGNLSWSVIFGGAPGSGSDTGRALAFDATGNIIVAGSATDANGKTDMLVKAFQPAGQPLWETRIDGPQHGVDVATDLVIDSNGAIFVAGDIDTSGLREAGVAKLDAQGQFQWLSRLNLSTPASLTDHFSRVISDGQGGAIAVGYYAYQSGAQTNSNGSCARFGSNGALQWSKFYGAGPSNVGQDAIIDKHGILNVVYNSFFTSPSDTAVQRFTIAGQLLSTSHYGGALNAGAHAAAFLSGAADQIYLLGYEGSAFGASSDQAFVMQRDSTGATDWIRRFAGNGFGPQIGFAQTGPLNRIVLCGSTTEPHPDALLMQINVSDAPQSYCTAKLNSLGCIPRIGFSGVSSAAATSGFALVVDSLINNKVGLFVYSASGSAATPFGGGLLCVSAPVHRSPGLNSAGNPPPANNCSGVCSIDLNAFARGALGGSPIAALTVPGTAVFMQLWGRDPGFAPPDNVTLSDALRYVVLP